MRAYQFITEAVKPVEAAIIAHALTASMGRVMKNAALKSIPYAGPLLGFYFAYDRYKNRPDDYMGMALEVATGITGSLGGALAGISLIITRDVYYAVVQDLKKQTLPEPEYVRLTGNLEDDLERYPKVVNQIRKEIAAGIEKQLKETAAKAAGLRGSELAQFMAQTRHESWDFSKMKEVGNKQRFAKYEQPRLAKQLGNKVKGDGERFKGRGFIQLTGRDNYTRASKQIFGDDRLVKNPDLASRLDVGAQIALWFWKNQVRPNVSNFNNTTEVVKAINAAEPMHVVQQRHNKFKEYLAVL
jgi:putative chitinase